jgi:hypothetical protein
MCQLRTHAAQQKIHHPIILSARKPHAGTSRPIAPRGLEIDDQLEVRRLLDRYIGTLGSAQNFSRQSCPLSQELGEPRTIANLCITANLAANVAVGS